MPMIIPALIMILFPRISIFRPIHTKPLIPIIFFDHLFTFALFPFSSLRREIKIKSFTLFTFFLLFSQFLFPMLLEEVLTDRIGVAGS
jgi:hypothetical protein